MAMNFDIKNIIETIDRLSELVTDEENYMNDVTANAYQEILIEEKDKTIVLNLKKFNELEQVIKSRTILLTVQKLFGTTKHIEKKHIDDIIKLCENNIGNKYLTPNKNTKIVVNHGKMYINKI